MKAVGYISKSRVDIAGLMNVTGLLESGNGLVKEVTMNWSLIAILYIDGPL